MGNQKSFIMQFTIFAAMELEYCLHLTGIAILQSLFAFESRIEMILCFRSIKSKYFKFRIKYILLKDKKILRKQLSEQMHCFL